MADRPTMTDEEMIKDYPRLKYEYAQLHQEFRKLSDRVCCENPDIIEDSTDGVLWCKSCGNDIILKR